MVWYLLAVGIGALFLVSLMGTGSQVELGYMDLVKLIEKGAPQSQSQGRDRGPGGLAGQGASRPLLRTWTI